MALLGSRRRLLPILSTILGFALITLLLLSRSSVKETWRDRTQAVAQRVGLGESLERWRASLGGESVQDTLQGGVVDERVNWKDNLVPGTTKPAGSNYTRMLVITRTKKENVTWLESELPDVDKVVYVADDPSAPLHPPANKGHEAIVYLTYIIDNYDALPDIMIFMHAHRRAWHNNAVLNSDAVEMVRRLSSEHVTRSGYMNLRCQWYPGCPDWMHPGNMDFDIQKTEQVLIAKAWAEIFPFDPVPDVLAQPCCSQFALSAARVRSIPRAQFIFYRDWLLNTKLKDFISGRVWEYMWQYAFTGRSFWCPAEHVCYCDGYGVCFGTRERYEEYEKLRERRDAFNLKLLKWQQQRKLIDNEIRLGNEEVARAMPQPEEGKDFEWWDEIQKAQKAMDVISDAAKLRGDDPKIRAQEAGRPWREGDGF